MRTELDQLASVGRLHIWSLSDALPEKRGLPIRAHLSGRHSKADSAETLDRSISQQSYLPTSGDEGSCGTFM
jgi:hypothetical protein